MKKFRIGLPVLAFAVAFAASAFTQQSSTANVPDPTFHWFSPSGTYLGERTVADQEVLCPGSGKLCANGYSEITEDEEPVGSIAATTQKQ